MEHKPIPIVIEIIKHYHKRPTINISLYHNIEMAQAHFLVICAEKYLPFNYNDTHEDNWYISNDIITMYIQWKIIL